MGAGGVSLSARHAAGKSVFTARFGGGNGKYENKEEDIENLVSADGCIDDWHCQRMYIR